MVYKIVQPPLQYPIPKMSSRDLRSYYHWFVENIDERTGMLEAEVQKSFTTWKRDFSVASLSLLDTWFRDQCEKRTISTEELAHVTSFTLPEVVPNWEFTDRTVSLAFDVALYFGEVFIRNHPGLNWFLQLGSRRNVDFGHVLISGFLVPLNPVRILQTLASIYCETGSTDERSLTLFYERWCELIAHEDG